MTEGGQSIEVQRSWHCGWLPRAEWTRHVLPADLFDGAYALPDHTPCDVCPGYLGVMPQIKEAAAATWALRKGVLSTYHPHPSAVLLDAVQMIDAAFTSWERRQLER
jgi:hypothetical protein